MILANHGLLTVGHTVDEVRKPSGLSFGELGCQIVKIRR